MRKQILLALGMVFLLFVLIDVFKSLLPTFSLPYIPNAYSPKGSLRSVDLSLPGGIPLQYITQGYGATSFAYAAGGYAKPWHNGVDIAAVEGAEIHSAKDGTIIFTGNQDNFCPGRGFGKFIVAQNSSDGFFLLYAHLSEIDVAAGSKVKKGGVVGRVGMTGFATAPHLHFSVFKPFPFSVKAKNGCGPDPSGQDINPLSYLK